MIRLNNDQNSLSEKQTESRGNSFYYLDVRNGNNHNMSFVIGDAYNLTCIDVDDENWANANWLSQLNSWNYFSNNFSGGNPKEEQ